MYKAIKMPLAVYRRVRALRQKIERHGWVSVGANRSDRCTLWSVIDEAVKRLEAGQKIRAHKEPR